ncbi:alpha-L-arabinofuranosidase [Mycena alexandri]|uniref:Alpha-L-arabinofuranosidase n=1 Tax=Mycena alexandri TaxID=1745969 RepID=A0AAD6SUE4_9AGAR|nr:alpha-L-arabinofuranosidase [Mycena alexandri]
MFQFSSLLALVLVTQLVAAAPCDIYASGGTPCVAAHSTTRALFSAYSGSLYQVQRGSDSATTNIGPLSAGGVANAAAQDSFCAGTTCVITTIFDQTGRSNHLTQAPAGGADPGPDFLAAADGAPVTLNGQKAYGVFISPGTGYRNDKTNGIATGDAAEGLYAVFDGTHFNNGCCFDYGNAEVSADDTGNGHMEAIYFGTARGGAGAGSGPWVLADLENGLYTSASPTGSTASNPTITERFVTAVVKGEPGNQWAVRGGNAQSGSLATFYSGVRPSNGYNPMSKEGAIILGIGGDNSDRSQGTFYEGVMTSGYPSDATENSVQANIVAAKYAITSMTGGPALTVGSAVSFRATTACCTTRYIAHTGATVNTQVVTSSDTATLRLSASWNVVAGLANSQCVSFESRDTPGSFIRHSGFELFVNANDGSQLFHEDATYCPQAGKNGQGNSIRSWSYPTHYFRHFNAILYAASNGGPDTFDATASYIDDVSFVVGAAFA